MNTVPVNKSILEKIQEYCIKYSLEPICLFTDGNRCTRVDWTILRKISQLIFLPRVQTVHYSIQQHMQINCNWLLQISNLQQDHQQSGWGLPAHIFSSYLASPVVCNNNSSCNDPCSNGLHTSKHYFSYRRYISEQCEQQRTGFTIQQHSSISLLKYFT